MGKRCQLCVACEHVPAAWFDASQGNAQEPWFPKPSKSHVQETNFDDVGHHDDFLR